jgi:hypothetical protein
MTVDGAVADRYAVGNVPRWVQNAEVHHYQILSGPVAHRYAVGFSKPK